MKLFKLKEFDNVRRGVIPGLDGKYKYDKEGAVIPNPEVEAQLASYKQLCDCKVGEQCEVPASASEWLKQFGWFGSATPPAPNGPGEGQPEKKKKGT